MAEDDFKERAEPANRERTCARLVRVSSAAGDEAEAPSSAGASVASDDLGSPKRRRGIRIPELIWEAILATQDPEHARFRVKENPDGTEELVPVKRPLSLKKQLRKLAGRAIAQDPGARLGSRQTQRDGRFWPKVNPEALADLLGISRATAYRWARDPVVLEWAEKMRQPAPIGRERHLMEPATKRDVLEARLQLEQRLEEIQADMRETLHVVLERFPDSAALAAAVDRFVDDALGD
jgi:hypothetical protein